MNLKNKILLLSLLLVSTASVVTTYISYTQLRAHFYHMDDVETETRIKKSYSALVEDTQQFYINRAYANMRSYGIKAALAAGDRRRLYELTLPRWKTLRAENPYLKFMQFHRGDGTSLLRVHDPERSGDPIALRRPMVASAHATHTIQSGYEEGMHGLGYRLLVPIFEEKRYLGALEFGIDPEYFVQKLRKLSGLETVLLLDVNRSGIGTAPPAVSEARYFGTMRAVNLDPRQRELLQAYSERGGLVPKRKMEHRSREYLFTTLPLSDYHRERIGSILFITDTTEQARYLSNLLGSHVIATLLIIVAVVLLFQAGYKRLLKQLTFSERFLELVFNAQKNLVVVTDGREMLQANSAVFDFFGYEDFEAFRSEHDCICDFFELGPHGEYLQQEIDGLVWSDYILQHPQFSHKVKIVKAGSPHIFTVTARQMHYDGKTRVVVVFTDITALEQMAKNDPLTGVPNRRSFELVLEKELILAQRHHYPLSLIYADVDHFKAVNDRFGHLVGDRVLVGVAEQFDRRLRSSDMLARWGGEEFVIMLSHTDAGNAAAIAEELRAGVEAADYGISDPVSCSFGVASLQNGDTVETIIRRADHGLYDAKAAGRNRVMIV